MHTALALCSSSSSFPTVGELDELATQLLRRAGYTWSGRAKEEVRREEVKGNFALNRRMVRPRRAKSRS